MMVEVVVVVVVVSSSSIIQIYSGITRGGVLDGELSYTKILEVHLFAFAYRLFLEDFSPINGALPEPRRLERNFHETVGKCKQIIYF